MDDLDHSIHIVEYEWMSFNEECEECSLLLPPIAGVEDSNLSDSEEIWSQDYSERCDALQTTAAKTSPVVVSLAVQHGQSFAKVLQVNQIYTDGQAEAPTAVHEEEGFLHARLNNPLEPMKCSRQDVLPTKEIQKQNHEIIEPTHETLFVQQTDSIDSQCSTDYGAHDMSMLSDLQRDKQSDIVAATTIQESEPLTGHKADLDMNDRNIQCTYNAKKTLCGKDSSVSIRKEKERWFVTVDVSNLQRKRRKKKNTTRNYPTCDGSLECRSKLEIHKSNEVESGNDLGPCEPLQQYLGAPVAVLSTGLQMQVLAETKQMHEDLSLLDSGECSLQPLTLETCPLSVAAPQSVNPQNSTLSNLTSNGQDIILLDSVETEDFKNGQGLCLANICMSRHQTAMLPNAVILKSESIKSLNSMESTEFKSAEEFSSSNVSDCENYASAPELTEDTWPLFKDHRSETKPEDAEQRSGHCNLFLSTPCDLFELCETDNVPHTDDGMLFPCDISHVHSAKHVSRDHESLQDPMPLQSDGCKTYREYTEPAMTCPPVGQSDTLMLENNSTSANETLNLMSQPSDSKPVEPCSMTKDQLQSPAVCDPTATPCSVADSPEAYAESLGHFQPVYAMSAFWDEMEKLTIRDILQLRLSGEQSSREALNTARPHDNNPDMQTDTKPQKDTVECLWSDTTSVDPSDNTDIASVDPSHTADSDYFTNPDDSKPDRSRCDFSTSSELDEEYWQLLGSSRDMSPDLLDTNLHMQSTAASSTCDSVENTTPVNEGTSVEQSLDDPHSFNSFPAGQTAHVRGIQKSKSMHNVQALTSTDKDTPFKPILENVDNSVLHITDLSMQKIPLIKVNDVLIDRTLSTILSNTDILDENYRISFPEVFEYLFEESKTDNDSRTIGIYADQSPTLCGCICSRYGSEGSLLSVQDSQWIKEKTIPIFICSRPSVRDLTFPEVDYLHPKAIHVDVESDPLPVGVVSHAPFHGVDPAPSSAAAAEALFNKRGWSSCLNSGFSIRKIHFHDHGSSWCQRSGPWVFPISAQRTTFKGANAVITLSLQRRFVSFPDQLFRELAADQQMLKGMPTSVSLSGKYE